VKVLQVGETQKARPGQVFAVNFSTFYRIVARVSPWLRIGE